MPQTLQNSPDCRPFWPAPSEELSQKFWYSPMQPHKTIKKQKQITHQYVFFWLVHFTHWFHEYQSVASACHLAFQDTYLQTNNDVCTPLQDFTTVLYRSRRYKEQSTTSHKTCHLLVKNCTEMEEELEVDWKQTRKTQSVECRHLCKFHKYTYTLE